MEAEMPSTDHGQTLPAGTRIEEFVIERVLGSGGFGITYLAKDARLDRHVVIKENLPVRLRPTAYALACDVVAADGEATQEELRYLEILRHDIGVDRLTAAAIERGAGARYARP